jgi:hypothetical protein
MGWAALARPSGRHDSCAPPDGLAINTQREGEFRHAGYRFATPGSLIEQAINREAAA